LSPASRQQRGEEEEEDDSDWHGHNYNRPANDSFELLEGSLGIAGVWDYI
jgi:hypothetical protein